jgi:hypothetical protein
MPHTVVGSEQRRRRGRPLSSRDRTFTSAPTQIVNVPYAYCGGGTVHRVVPTRSHSAVGVRAGSVTAVRIPLCGDTCAQMRKASCSVRPCRLAVKNVPSYAATAVRDRCVSRSLHCSVRAPFSLLRYRLATHMEVRHAQPVFSLGLRAAWLMYVPSLWSRNARSARSWPHRRRHRHTVVRSKCSTACSP